MPETPQLALRIHISLAKGRILGLINSRLRLESISADAAKTLFKYFNQRNTAISYKVEDHVWLSCQNIRTNCPAKKLDFKYLGLLTIEKCVCSQAYKLKLPITFHNIHDVFHISFLKPY